MSTEISAGFCIPEHMANPELACAVFYLKHYLVNSGGLRQLPEDQGCLSGEQWDLTRKQVILLFKTDVLFKVVHRLRNFNCVLGDWYFKL